MRQYNDGIPADSRFANHKDFFKQTLDSLTEEEGLAKIAKVKALTELAEKGACFCSIARDGVLTGRLV